MNVFFNKCSDAVAYTGMTKTFGIYHSTENNPNLNIHTHECCEILLCKNGGKNFLIDDKIYAVHPNDLFIINQFEAHKITFEENTFVERYIIQIHPEFIFSSSSDDTDLSKCFYQRDNNTSNRLELNNAEADFIASQLEAMKKENAYGDDIIKNAIMVTLLAFFNEKFLNNHPTADKIQNKQLKNVVLYINEHLSDELTLEQIAKNSYMSVNQLCKIFKSSLGTTVKKYIIGKRISQAKMYLKNGYSVSDTAYMCGFHDYSNFIRTFVSSVGISPGKYRSSQDHQ